MDLKRPKPPAKVVKLYEDYVVFPVDAIMMTRMKLKGPKPPAKLVRQIVRTERLNQPLKEVRLQKTGQSFTYRGRFNYLVVHNPNAGMPNVYTVYALNVDDPVTVGRELPLEVVRATIARYEALAPDRWIGNRRPILAMLRKFKVLIK